MTHCCRTQLNPIIGLSAATLLIVAGCRQSPPQPEAAATVQSTAAIYVSPSPRAATPTPPPLPPSLPASTRQTPTPSHLPPSRTSLPPLPDPLPTLVQGKIGIQLHLQSSDQTELFAHLSALNVSWVKVQLSWKLYQPEPDRYDDFWFDALDAFVATANQQKINVLISVAKAPEWSRPTTEEDGPPSEVAHFEAFMTLIGERYAGKVAAYELWNEPNLGREWRGFPIDPDHLAQLTAAGIVGLRQADEQALVISAAPAPTGINDGISAVDDRRYFQGMVDAGIPSMVDGMGVHPYGWANPPASRLANPDPAAFSHNNHPSFFFFETMTDYQAILAENGIDDTQLWATEFGWASFEGFDAPLPEGMAFSGELSESMQAAYILSAFETAGEWNFAGPFFLWNLNFAPILGTKFAESGYSILRPDGSPRPAYLALQLAPRQLKLADE